MFDTPSHLQTISGCLSPQSLKCFWNHTTMRAFGEKITGLAGGMFQTEQIIHPFASTSVGSTSYLRRSYRVLRQTCLIIMFNCILIPYTLGHKTKAARQPEAAGILPRRHGPPTDRPTDQSLEGMHNSAPLCIWNQILSWNGWNTTARFVSHMHCTIHPRDLTRLQQV